MKCVTLQDHCKRLIAAHGSVRLAAKAIDIDHAYLFKLSRGEKVNPRAKTLAKLGLEIMSNTTRYKINTRAQEERG